MNQFGTFTSSPIDGIYFFVGIDKARFRRTVVPGDQLHRPAPDAAGDQVLLVAATPLCAAATLCKCPWPEHKRGSAIWRNPFFLCTFQTG